MDIQEMNQIEVVYFSGTGGTRRIADAFVKELEQRGKHVTVTDLGAGVNEEAQNKQSAAESEFYLVVFPVYAFDAPKPVYHWVETLDRTTAGKKAAVISVSGGGEGWPNTGCRSNLCKRLEDQGLQIVFDSMMCMPANMLAEVNDHLAMQLIRIIPSKVNQALDMILSGEIRRTRHHKSALRNYLTGLENNNSGRFAKELQISDECAGCGWCAKNCPTQNITIDGTTNKPVFADKCTICMRCVYGCPMHAMSSKSRMVFKKGFDLDALEERMAGIELEPVEKCCRGIAFSGVKKYLQNKY